MAAAVLLLQAVPAAAFAPPLDTPLRAVIERREEDMHYRAERLVRFQREGAGYRAELRIVVAHAEGPGRTSALFEAGYSGLIDRILVFHLDRSGKVTGIDDLAGVWKRFCMGMVALTEGDEARKAMFAAPLIALPEAQQRAMLYGLVEDIIPPERNEEPGRIRPVRVPASSPFRAPMALEGMHSVTIENGLLRATTRAQGDGAEGHVELVTSREIDTSTGLLLRSSDMLRTTTAGAVHERWTTQTLTPEAQTTWP